MSSDAKLDIQVGQGLANDTLNNTVIAGADYSAKISATSDNAKLREDGRVEIAVSETKTVTEEEPSPQANVQTIDSGLVLEEMFKDQQKQAAAQQQQTRQGIYAAMSAATPSGGSTAAKKMQQEQMAGLYAGMKPQDRMKLLLAYFAKQKLSPVGITLTELSKQSSLPKKLSVAAQPPAPSSPRYGNFNALKMQGTLSPGLHNRLKKEKQVERLGTVVLSQHESQRLLNKSFNM